MVLKKTVPFLVLGALLAGCATPPPQSDTAAYQAYQEQNDPLQPTNRVFYKVNDVLDNNVLKPVAIGYKDITTTGFRQHVDDFATNLGEPARLVNFMMEGKSRLAGTALVRFLMNSTVGIGGIFDPATAVGYPETNTDFGLTLADWGVGEGPYLYLPLLGPSGVRDATNIPIEFLLTPTAAPPASTGLSVFSYSETGLSLVNTRTDLLGPIDQIKETALDPYATFRSLYRQNRASQLKQIEKRNVLTTPDWYPQPAQK